MKAYTCGVPEEHRIGTRYLASAGIRGRDKRIQAHGTREDAFNCMKHYLVDILNYEQIGPREFSPPDGGPVRVLTKKSRYGGFLRKGKEDTRVQPSGPHAGGIVSSH